MTRKLVTSVRLTQAGRERIAARALGADVDFSRMVRRMLAYADLHMPAGWVPPRAAVGHDSGRNPR